MPNCQQSPDEESPQWHQGTIKSCNTHGSIYTSSVKLFPDTIFEHLLAKPAFSRQRLVHHSGNTNHGPTDITIQPSVIAVSELFGEKPVIYKTRDQAQSHNSSRKHKYMREGSVERVCEALTSVPFIASQNTVTTSIHPGVNRACPRASLPLPQSGRISAHQPAPPNDNTERSLIRLPPLEFPTHSRQSLPSLGTLLHGRDHPADSVTTKQSGWHRATLAELSIAPSQKSSEYTAQISTISKHDYAHDGGWQPPEETLQNPAACERTFHCGILACSTARHGPLQSMSKLHQGNPQQAHPVDECIRSNRHSSLLRQRQHCNLPSLSSFGRTSSLCRPLSSEGQGEHSMNGASTTNESLASPSGLNLAFPRSSMATQTVQQYTLRIVMAKKKSRVDSGIPTRLVLFPMPQGGSTIRLPSLCMAKLPVKPPPPSTPSAHTLQLYVSVVCWSKIQDKEQLMKAFVRAQRFQEAEALDGGKVKICPRCLRREEKRYKRKSLTEFGNRYFQANKGKRLVLLSTWKTKSWSEFHKDVSTAYVDSPVSSVHVDFSMRITCCCHHHDEKKGFGVIFTVKDHRDNVIAQAITDPITIINKRRSHDISSL